MSHFTNSTNLQHVHIIIHIRHRKGAGGIEPVGKYAATGGGRQPGVRLVLPDGDACGPSIWSGSLCAI